MSRTVRACFAFAMAFVPFVAGATSFIVPTDRQMVDKSDAIVIGAVEGSYVRAGDANSDASIETVYEIRVDRSLKGSIEAGRLLRDVESGGVLGNFGLIVPGSARFVSGEKVMLFLIHHRDHWESTDMMLGKFRFATTSHNEKVLIRDTDDADSATVRSLTGEPVRAQSGFIRFVEDVVAGRAVEERYRIESTGSVRNLASESLQPSINSAVYSAESYTQKNGALGTKWDPTTAASGISYVRRTGCGSPSCDIGTPDAGITAGMAAWTNECPSQVRQVLAGTTSTAAGATASLGGLCGMSNCPFDEVNVIEFNDPQSKLGVGAWTGSGLIAKTFIAVNSVSTPNVGSNFCEILDADIIFRQAYNPSTEPTFATAVTHELGHSIGWRHSNATPASPNDTTNTCNSSTEECATASDAIMFATVNSALSTNLQPWDIHAVDAVYPGGICTTRGDFNADIKADILLRDTSGSLGLWTMNGAIVTNGAFVGSPGGSYTVAGVGDFNGDGKADILLRDNLGNLGLWIMNGSTITSGAFVGAPGGSYTVVGVADFNGDGKADILLRDINGSLGMWLMNGATITSGAFVGSPGGTYNVAGVADFNGDGKADILLRDSLGSLGMWLMNGSTITSGAFVGSPGGSYTVAGVGDFTGDRKADILLRDNLGNLGMWIMNGPVISSGAFVGSPGGSYTVAAVNDYNGDGRFDILLRDTNGSLGMWIMNGPSITSGAFVGSPGSSYTEY